MASEQVSKAQMEKYKNKVKQKLIDNLDLFFANLQELKPKDMCDVYLKMLPYGISKVPEEIALNDSESQKIVLEETKRKATLIAGGVPQSTEDTNYEDEGWDE